MMEYLRQRVLSHCASKQKQNDFWISPRIRNLEKPTAVREEIREGCLLSKTGPQNRWETTILEMFSARYRMGRGIYAPSSRAHSRHRDTVPYQVSLRCREWGFRMLLPFLGSKGCDFNVLVLLLCCCDGIAGAK